jgi:hypothetical protein
MFGKSNNIDLMTVKHFIIWFIIGYFCPNKYLFALILSIMWEKFELIIILIDPLYKFVKKYWFVPEIYWNENPKNIIIDIGVNMLGYLVGTSLYVKLLPGL